MPELAWNQAYWDGGYDWKTAGEEWSEAWGGEHTYDCLTLFCRADSFASNNSVFVTNPKFMDEASLIRDF